VTNVFRLFFCVVITFFSLKSFACSFPQKGDEFDQLITIEYIGNNEFKAIIEREALGAKFGIQVTANYYPSTQQYRLAEYRKDIFGTFEGDHFIAEFELKAIEGYTPYIEVFWFPQAPGLCGAFGNSEDLTLE